jgi:hypothetical protein
MRTGGETRYYTNANSAGTRLPARPQEKTSSDHQHISVAIPIVEEEPAPPRRAARKQREQECEAKHNKAFRERQTRCAPAKQGRAADTGLPARPHKPPSAHTHFARNKPRQAPEQVSDKGPLKNVRVSARRCAHQCWKPDSRSQTRAYLRAHRNPVRTNNALTLTAHERLRSRLRQGTLTRQDRFPYACA